MFDTPGTVIDPYDDDFGSLRVLLGGKRPPEFIKTASVMNQKDLQRLPDHAFAMVYVGPDRPMRKYACVDPAHVAVNVMYFIEARDNFPPAAKEKVAANLLAACHHFKLKPPPALVKEASGRKVLIKTEGTPVMVAKRKKEADLSGGPVMPHSARPSMAKMAGNSVIKDPYVVQDAGFVVRKALLEKKASLQEDLPLHSYGQVQEAVAFFQSFGDDYHPRERHEMCVKIASRAQQLGVPLDEVVRKYGSQEFETPVFLKAAAEKRRQLWVTLNEDGTAPNLLDMLMEKQASGAIEPEVFAEALAEVDVLTGIDRYWDSEIPDPWFTTFGRFEKVAADDQWRWSQGTETLNKDQLENFVKSSSGQEVLEHKFGESMSKGLRGAPVTVFDSLPMDTKRAIARMAQQHESGL